MSGSEPSEDEWAGLEVVRRVVEVADYERLVPSGRDGARTPDWRVWIAQERVADVEVTLCTDIQTIHKATAEEAKAPGSTAVAPGGGVAGSVR